MLMNRSGGGADKLPQEGAGKASHNGHLTSFLSGSWKVSGKVPPRPYKLSYFVHYTRVPIAVMAWNRFPALSL